MTWYRSVGARVVLKAIKVVNIIFWGGRVSPLPVSKVKIFIIHPFMPPRAPLNAS